MKHSVSARVASCAALFALASFSTPATRAADPGITRLPFGGVSVLRVSPDGALACSDAAGEDEAAAKRAGDVPLHVIYAGREGKAEAGLSITLRATAQLEASPAAKAAFIAAAAEWEALVLTPIAIVIDVDYGRTRFGTPYPTSVLGSTDSQTLVDDELPTLRQALVDSATGVDEGAYYSLLSTTAIPTTVGPATRVAAPSAVFRAVGRIDAVADPAGEATLGRPPSIGFNSAHPFDLDASNGVDADKYDFKTVVQHEIGHVLGFTSCVGWVEAYHTQPIVSVWDLFRFRPGAATLAGFGSTDRVLSRGGDQVFFMGDGEAACSTGGPDGSGGDGRQASHWKDDALSPGSQPIGLMDPTLARGTRETVTAADLRGLDFLGYTVGDPPPAEEPGVPPSISAVVGDLSGDVLTLTGAATDLDNDIASARVTLVDAAGQTVGAEQTLGVALSGSTFTVAVPGLGAAPTATAASVVLVDARNHASAAAAVGFSAPDSGGPALASAEARGRTLRLYGSGFPKRVVVEVNGVVVTPPAHAKVGGGGTRVVLRGKDGAFNLRTGPNRVRLSADGLRSNTIVLTVE